MCAGPCAFIIGGVWRIRMRHAVPLAAIDGATFLKYHLNIVYEMFVECRGIGGNQLECLYVPVCALYYSKWEMKKI